MYACFSPLLYQMERLNFPEYAFKFREGERKKMIFDVVRKKYVVLTPEEWVRQHCVAYLNQEKHVSLSHLAVESSIQYQGMPRRCDLIAYREGIPHLLVECKAPHIPLKSGVVEQLARYQSVVHVPYMWITNGIHHLYLHYNGEKVQILDTLEMD